MGDKTLVVGAQKKTFLCVVSVYPNRVPCGIHILEKILFSFSYGMFGSQLTKRNSSQANSSTQLILPQKSDLFITLKACIVQIGS